MKTLKRIAGSNVEKTLEKIVEQHARMKNCFFWTPPQGAAARRSYEKDNSASIEFVLNGVHYEILQSVECSCKNIYYFLDVKLDGVKKDVRALKKLLRSK